VDDARHAAKGTHLPAERDGFFVRGVEQHHVRLHGEPTHTFAPSGAGHAVARGRVGICTKFISPAIERAGWDMQSQLREEVYITNGRIMVRGRMTKRAAGKRVDYILCYKPNIPIAIVEAKDNNHRVGDGMQQALEYAEMIDVPFVFSSNGDAFLAHDRTGQSKEVEREIQLDQFSAP
jgi:type I site-specific restriction endonuclease